MGKRVLLLTVSVLFSLTLFAQFSKSVDGKRIYYVAVMVEFDGKWKGTASIDYGYVTNGMGLNKDLDRMLDEDGNVLHFESKFAMINYMTLQGWTYLSSIDDMYRTNTWAYFAKEMTDAEANNLLPKLASKANIDLDKMKKK